MTVIIPVVEITSQVFDLEELIFFKKTPTKPKHKPKTHKHKI